MLIIYGFRLGGDLLLREVKIASYRSTMKKEIKDGADMLYLHRVYNAHSLCNVIQCGEIQTSYWIKEHKP